MFELQKELESKMLLLDYYEKQFIKVKEDITDINNKLDVCYKKYQELGDLEKEVYVEFFKKQWTVIKIADYHGCSDRKIYRILKSLKEKMN